MCLQSFREMAKFRFGAALGVSIVFWSAALGAQEGAVGETRALVAKWVEARKLIAREKRDWADEKAMMTQLIARYESELETVDKEIEEAQSSADKAQKEREALLAENDDLIESADRMETLVAGLEKRLRGVLKLFPEPLMRDQLERLVKQMPENSDDTRASLSARLQLIVAILQEAQKFNSGIAVVSEIRENEAGEDVQVETIYLGLAYAYFVDQSEKFAGFGVPGEEEWEWTVAPELGARIAKTLAQYNESAPASYTPLPVTVQ